MIETIIASVSERVAKEAFNMAVEYVASELRNAPEPKQYDREVYNGNPYF